ncbi:MAG: hypothetical protein P8P74_08335 [Crocinitomicaceae bacterium]|nr:hypothetical protein [Crocinitomicaceae bacterium]
MSHKLEDGLRFENEDERVIFNHYSFCEIVKHIMVEYGRVTYHWADAKFKDSFLFDPVGSEDDVSLLSHELEFHWAMLLVHGEMYWTKGIPSDFNDFKEEYLNWERAIRKRFKLKKSFEYFDLNTE